MLYWLVDLSDRLSVLNVFRYITFRTGGAIVTALLFVFLFGPFIIDMAARAAGQGPADPRRRAAIAHLDQGRHADHGRADDPVGHAGVDPAVGESGQSLCLDRAGRHAQLRRWSASTTTISRSPSRPTTAFPAAPRWRIEAVIAVAACVVLVQLGRPPFVDLAGVSVLQGAGDRSRLVLRRSSAPSSSSAPAMR